MSTSVASVNTGATIGVSSALPATFDAAGYNALTFTSVGEVVDVGELAKVWAMVNHQSVSRQFPQKLKDTYDIANVTMTLARDFDDAGQVIIAAGLDATTCYSFKITLPSGDTAEFTALIVKSGLGAVASGAVSTTMIELGVDAESLFEA